MVIVADTSALLAAFNPGEPDHEAVVAELESGRHDKVVVSPYVVAELDYLLLGRLDVAAELAVLDELTAGGYELAQLAHDDVARAVEVVRKYHDQRIGLADASLVVLAERHGTRDILTLDRRHFSVLRTPDRKRFRILPG